MVKRNYLLWMSAWLMAGVLAGCASGTSVLSRMPDPNLVWPVPPDAPRVSYLHSIHLPQDIGVKESALGRLVALVAGRKKRPTVERPIGIYADRDGWLMVADTGLQVTHIFNLKRQSYAQAFQLPNGRLDTPVGVAFDPNRKWLFVADSSRNRIFIFDTDGIYIGEIDSDFLRVSGLVWDASQDRLIAVDTGHHRIQIFDRDGHRTAMFGERGAGQGQLNFPTHVTVDSSGQIYVTDSLNFRVQLFSIDGQPVRQVGQLGSTLGTFSKPKGVAVDSNDHLFVVDGLYDVVQLFDKDGQLLMFFGGSGNKDGQFWLPAGIAVAGDDVFVADTYNHRVQIFRLLDMSVAAPTGT